MPTLHTQRGAARYQRTPRPTRFSGPLWPQQPRPTFLKWINTPNLRLLPTFAYVKHQNFPTHFCLSLSLECSGEISRQSAKSAYPINSVKVDVFLSKSYARFSLVKVRKKLAPRLEIISPDQTAHQWNDRTSYRL